MENETGVIYITSDQDMLEDMVFDNGVSKDKAQGIVDELMGLLNLDLLPGATLIEDTIVGDELFANKLKEKYGIEMTKIDLYKFYRKGGQAEKKVGSGGLKIDINIHFIPL